MHALAEPVLAGHQFVLVERDDRVAPAGEVFTEVGVALVVAFEEAFFAGFVFFGVAFRAARRFFAFRGQVAAAVVAVDEQDQRRFAGEGFRLEHHAADLRGDRFVGTGRRVAGAVRFLEGGRPQFQRVGPHHFVRPGFHRVGQFGVFRGAAGGGTAGRGREHQRGERDDRCKQHQELSRCRHQMVLPVRAEVWTGGDESGSGPGKAQNAESRQPRPARIRPIVQAAKPSFGPSYRDLSTCTNPPGTQWPAGQSGPMSTVHGEGGRPCAGGRCAGRSGSPSCAWASHGGPGWL